MYDIYREKVCKMKVSYFAKQLIVKWVNINKEIGRVGCVLGT